MTGLKLGADKIIEIAAVITDGDLTLIEPEGFQRVIHHPENVMNGMDEWCTEQHGQVACLPVSY
jgi:oligoribonuclease